LVILR